MTLLPRAAPLSQSIPTSARKPVRSPLRRQLALGAGAAALLLGSGCAPGQPLRIGFLGGLTGRLADLGIGARDGTQLAIDDLNASGGIHGRSIELLPRDDAQSNAVARAQLTDLFDSGVALVIGPITSSVAAALVPLANARGIALVSPLAGAPEFNGRNDAFFRVVSSPALGARQMAEAMLQRGLRRVVTVADQRNAVFSQGWARAFAERFSAGGGSVLPALEFEAAPGLKFLDLAARIAGAGADVVAIAASATDSAVLVQQLRRLQPGMFVGLSVWAGTEELLQLGGRAIDGVLVTQFFDRFNTTPRWLDFVARFSKRFGQPPGYAPMCGYDAMQFAAQALRQAGQSDAPGLLAALAQIRSLDGLQRTLNFDAFGDCLAPTYLTEIRAGRYVAAAV